MFKKAQKIFLITVMGLNLDGCAKLAFYSDKTLNNETGLPVYTQKPFLLVAKTGQKDKPVEVSIQYITDTSHPIYVKPESGIGSAELSAQIANGAITGFGQKTDTKIPELISSLAGLGTSMATAGETFAKTALLKQGANIPEIINKIDLIIPDLSKNIKLAKSNSILTAIEINILSNVEKDLEECKQLLIDPAKAESNLALVITKLDDSLKNWQGIGKPADGATSPENIIRRNLEQIRTQIQQLHDSLAPQPINELPSFKLFEIKYTDGKATLIEVY